MNEITTVIELKETLVSQKKQFNKNTYPSYSQRISDLKTLKSLLLTNQQAFIDAMSLDFGHRSADDSMIGDILTTISGINYTIKKLKGWMKTKKKHISVLFQPAKGEVIYQPKGVIGIIAPWNYPVFLSLGPLTAALAAGNTAMIKMSEYTPSTNILLAKLLSNAFSTNQVAIVTGEVEMATAFSQLKFDHIFFTGSTNVGRIVMKSAAENLIPVTLELGGKSPSIIDNDIDLKLVASRLVFGKVLNAGQTCVAPDYILCPHEKIDELTAKIRTLYLKMYPTTFDNDDCTCIVSDAQKSRLDNLLIDAKNKGAKITPLSDEKNKNDRRKMPLTVVTNTTEEMTLMQQEIFGPILPIIGYDDIQSAIDYVNKHDRPLSLYIYSFNKILQQEILLKTHAGGVCINDATFHVASDDLPFGGIGPSGMGQYHGEEGFKTFSHGKAVFTRGRISFAHFLFPPFGTAIHKFVYKFFIR